MYIPKEWLKNNLFTYNFINRIIKDVGYIKFRLVITGGVENIARLVISDEEHNKLINALKKGQTFKFFETVGKLVYHVDYIKYLNPNDYTVHASATEYAATNVDMYKHFITFSSEENSYDKLYFVGQGDVN